MEVSFTNAANATYDAAVFLLPRPADRIRVTLANGSTTVVGNLSAVRGVGLYEPPCEHEPAPRDVEPMGVEPLATRGCRGIGPRSSVSSTFEFQPRNATPFAVVTGPDGVCLWATATCGEGDYPNAFDVEVCDGGPGVSVACESFRMSSDGPRG